MIALTKEEANDIRIWLNRQHISLQIACAKADLRFDDVREAIRGDKELSFNMIIGFYRIGYKMPERWKSTINNKEIQLTFKKLIHFFCKNLSIDESNLWFDNLKNFESWVNECINKILETRRNDILDIMMEVK